MLAILLVHGRLEVGEVELALDDVALPDVLGELRGLLPQGDLQPLRLVGKALVSLLVRP